LSGLCRSQAQRFRDLWPRHFRATSSEQETGLDLVEFRPGGGEQPQPGTQNGLIRSLDVAGGPRSEPDQIGIRGRLARVLPRAAREAIGAGLHQRGTESIQIGGVILIIGGHFPTSMHQHVVVNKLLIRGAVIRSIPMK
jgi:hypothetical protein